MGMPIPRAAAGHPPPSPCPPCAPASSRSFDTVTLPVNGLTVRIRSLFQTEISRHHTRPPATAWCLRSCGGSRIPNGDSVALVVCDDQGKTILSEADVQAMALADPAQFYALYRGRQTLRTEPRGRRPKKLARDRRRRFAFRLCRRIGIADPDAWLAAIEPRVLDAWQTRAAGPGPARAAGGDRQAHAAVAVGPPGPGGYFARNDRPAGPRRGGLRRSAVGRCGAGQVGPAAAAAFVRTML